MKAKNHSKGFTLIEIVLVLAIAGLLLVVVFLAVTGAQKSRRDYQRKSDLAHLIASVETWQGNHSGQFLDSEADLLSLGSGYMQGRNDPKTGVPYTYQFYSSFDAHMSVAPPVGQISFQSGHVCGSDAGGGTYVTGLPGTPHQIDNFAAIMSLEGGGVYCLDHR